MSDRYQNWSVPLPESTIENAIRAVTVHSVTSNMATIHAEWIVLTFSGSMAYLFFYQACCKSRLADNDVLVDWL